MKKKAWLTYNKNLNRLALRRRRALGTRVVKDGLTYKQLPAPTTVMYCSACGGPVVDDELGRRRHGFKTAACKAAMEIARKAAPESRRL
jgi:hypothetical protein